MLEYNIQKSDFEKQKNELKTFAETPATSTKIDSFSTGGKWSDFWSGGLAGVLSGHKVTGEEMNILVTELQSCFAEINERDRKVIKEFGQVYETFEALDKGYIQGILIGVKSAEKASQEAKDAQKDIDDTIKMLQITIEKLKEFKDEVKKHVHLKDIDEIWKDIRRFEKDLKELAQKSKKQVSETDRRLSELGKFKAVLEKQKHLNDIDTIWNDVLAQGKKIEDSLLIIKELSDGLTKRIGEMHAVQEQLDGIEHLADIDIIWGDTQKLNESVSKISTDITNQMVELKKDFSGIKTAVSAQKHFNDIDNMWGELQNIQKKIMEQTEELERYGKSQEDACKAVFEVIEFISDMRKLVHLTDIDTEWDFSHKLSDQFEISDKKITDIESQIIEYEERLQISENDNKLLKSKIRTVYIIAGSAVGLSLIQLLLQLMGVL